MLDVFDSTADLSVVLATQSVPMIAFLLLGGAVADRFPRSAVLVVSSLGAALTQGAVAALLLAGTDRLGLLLVPLALNGMFAGFSSPALRGAVPQLVSGPAAAQRANSLLATARSASRVVGPSLSGVLVATVGGGWALVVDALGYLVAAGCMALVRLPAPADRRKTRLLADLREGWTEFRALRWISTVVVVFTGLNFLLGGVWLVLGPVIARETVGEAAWGVALSARAAGLLVMGALMYRITVRYLLRFGQAAVALVGVPFVVLALDAPAGRLVAAAFAAAFVAGLGSGVSGVAWDTSLQEHVPPAVFSRVASYDDLGSFLAVPLGQLLVVPIAAAAGDRVTAAVGGILYIGLALSALAARPVWNLRHAR